MANAKYCHFCLVCIHVSAFDTCKSGLVSNETAVFILHQTKGKWPELSAVHTGLRQKGKF